MSHTPSREEIAEFKRLVDLYRYDFCKLVYVIFPFGQPGHDLEHKEPYDWQMEEWEKLSKHLQNPETRFETYRLGVSSGNGAAKTAFGAMTNLMLLYSQKLRARITANTDPQMKSVVWPEYDKWFRYARYHDFYFEKFGTSIKARDPEVAETWRLDAVTWNETAPASISGLHNEGFAIAYTFEEAPGIPAIIFNYASGALTDVDTIKVFMAFGNSDDPESKFEQNMTSPIWHGRRIDTRELKHVDKKQISDWLIECNGNEDHDEFRVRVRGLPRKTAKDSIINVDNVNEAVKRGDAYDRRMGRSLPSILSCDPAWTGGDETTIWWRQGPYARLLEKYKLDKAAGDTHNLTFTKLLYWEQKLQVDQVFIDQGEGTALYTLAANNGKTSWDLINFANSPNDTAEFKDSAYHNLRAQMYYESNLWLLKGGMLGVEDPEWMEMVKKQLCWAKGARHKITQKKMVEAKLDIKTRVGQSPDIADGFVLLFARPVLERLDEHAQDFLDRTTGSGAWKMPEPEDPYKDDGEDLYHEVSD